MEGFIKRFSSIRAERLAESLVGALDLPINAVEAKARRERVAVFCLAPTARCECAGEGGA